MRDQSNPFFVYLRHLIAQPSFIGFDEGIHILHVLRDSPTGILQLGGLVVEPSLVTYQLTEPGAKKKKKKKKNQG